MLFLIIMYVVTLTAAGPINKDTNNVNKSSKPTRRILQGRPVGDTKPYMVYLRPSLTADPKFTESNWICGGAIIHERYILTSAACIEDAKTFYVISGTNKWSPITEKNDECVNNGAKRAVWKCVPKSYVFDGYEFDNIRWMVGDIAVVKVEDDFNFERRIKGCDFIPKKVAYNNFSMDLEKPGTFGSIAGWGSNDSYKDWIQDPPNLRTEEVAAELQETEVKLISNGNCKKRWEPRYHYIIDEQMICTKDVSDVAMSALCAAHEINCKELEYDDNDYEDYEVIDQTFKRMAPKPGQLKVHNSGHYHDTRKNSDFPTGGFCENDHGGPLIVGHGKSEVIVGVMSACQTKDISRKCTGPFLFTNVYRYRNMITCAIDKELRATCRKLLRSSHTPTVETYFDWSNNDDRTTTTKVKREKKIKRAGDPPKTTSHYIEEEVTETRSDNTNDKFMYTNRILYYYSSHRNTNYVYPTELNTNVSNKGLTTS